MLGGDWLCKCGTVNEPAARICEFCARRRGSWFRSSWMPVVLALAAVVAVLVAISALSSRLGR